MIYSRYHKFDTDISKISISAGDTIYEKMYRYRMDISILSIYQSSSTENRHPYSLVQGLMIPGLAETAAGRKSL